MATVCKNVIGIMLLVFVNLLFQHEARLNSTVLTVAGD